MQNTMQNIALAAARKSARLMMKSGWLALLLMLAPAWPAAQQAVQVPAGDGWHERRVDVPRPAVTPEDVFGRTALVAVQPDAGRQPVAARSV